MNLCLCVQSVSVSVSAVCGRVSVSQCVSSQCVCQVQSVSQVSVSQSVSQANQ